MSLSPTTYMSKLSLEGTPSPKQLDSPMQSPQQSPSVHESAQYSDESDWDDDEETPDTVSSPTGLKYNIAHLSDRTQKVVRGLFNAQDPPRISLELCGIKEDDPHGGGVFYAFQMHEVAPCSIRIGPRNSKRFSVPKCECPDARYRHIRPCKHLIWLFDRISKQALFDHDPESHLTLTELGYPEELGDPFRQISEIRLDVLVDSLHCDTTAPNSDTAPPNPARVKQAREIVAAVAGIQPRDVDRYRLDLETSYSSGAPLVRPGDVEATLFSLILASHSLAACLRAELSASDPAVDPFRAIQQRALRVITELDDYSASLKDSAVAAARKVQGKEAEGPRNVSWAATQIRHCVSQIERIVSRGSHPLADSARASAARALVGILLAVANHNVDSHAGDSVDDRNLYMCLLGNYDTGFVYSALDTLVDQSQFIEELEDVMDLLGRSGAPVSYVANIRGLITRMRSYTAGSGRRPSGDFTVGAVVPRSPTPVLQAATPFQESDPRPSGRSPGPSNTGSGNTVHFLTPEVPASMSRGRGRGRGNRAGGAGSKRSVSGSGQDRGRGSKRAR
ncbi:hypothetical protein B0T25DRAFT_635393 [Lasiosphaeria hispida]|uniref:SWIM-type domain-containing protein n=1 Tax=Lasiosphaeria hispida TaxID=260671 RepID=A0AAJ0H5S6_9PEZI|nr:hypothetical protein B0T25DRAFT_635393 [Lasiosphaeria hispida]